MDTIKILQQLDRIENLLRASKTAMSLDEASEYTLISRSYLYKLTAQGETPFLNPGGKSSTSPGKNWITSFFPTTKNQLVN